MPPHRQISPPNLSQNLSGFDTIKNSDSEHWVNQPDYYHYPKVFQDLQQQGFFDYVGSAQALRIIPSSRRKTVELQILPNNPRLLELEGLCSKGLGMSDQSTENFSLPLKRLKPSDSSPSQLWEIQLRVPACMPHKEISSFLLSRQGWLRQHFQKLLCRPHQLQQIHNSIQADPDILRLLVQKELVWGQPTLFLGKAYLLQKHAPKRERLAGRRQRTDLQIGSDILSFPCPHLEEGTGLAMQQQKLSPQEQKCLGQSLRTAALELLQSRCELYSTRFMPKESQATTAVKVRSYKARWGCCSPAGELTFNWQLIFAPLSVVDYVVVHELAHLVEFNHSPQFWQLVAQVIPDYKLYKQWLYHCGHYLLRF